jgi:predicted CoA-binding protein
MTDQNIDDHLRTIFRSYRVWACVGASANPARPSHYVSEFLRQKGFRIIPVNPGLAGQELFGETVYATLSDIPEPVEVVDVFRRSEAVPALVEEALALRQPPKVFWTQLGVFAPDTSAKMAASRGMVVVQNRCPKIEYPRLFGSRDRSAITA